jgi:hypothetical protein
MKGKRKLGTGEFILGLLEGFVYGSSKIDVSTSNSDSELLQRIK